LREIFAPAAFRPDEKLLSADLTLWKRIIN